MRNPVLEKIKNFAAQELREAYGYCGLADSDDSAMLNSDDKNGKDIKIIINTKEEEK